MPTNRLESCCSVGSTVFAHDHDGLQLPEISCNGNLYREEEHKCIHNITSKWSAAQLLSASLRGHACDVMWCEGFKTKRKGGSSQMIENICMLAFSDLSLCNRIAVSIFHMIWYHYYVFTIGWREEMISHLFIGSTDEAHIDWFMIPTNG